MNSRKIILTLLTVTGIFLFSGCKKFLKELSQDEMTPTTVSSLSELLAREGYPYISAASAADGFAICEYLNWLDDDVKLQNVTFQFTLVDYVKPFYAWSDNMYIEAKTASTFSVGGKNPYQSLYNRIRGCNVVMDMLEEVSGSEAEKDQLRGEALTLRAYYYFMLVNLYSWPYNDPNHDKNSSPGVPIIKSGGISDVPVARNSVKEVYDFISADIETAAALLAKEKNITTQFRINYRASWLLASRIFVHMEEWDKVIEYTDKLINDYPIVTDLNTWPVPKGTLAVTTNTNANFIDPSNTEVLFLFSGIRSCDLHSFGLGGLAMYSLIATPELMSIYEPNDMRFAVYDANNVLPNFFLTRLSGYYMQSKVYSNGRAGRCFRMAEAYVNRAEAQIRKVIKGGDAGLLQKALDDLNYLRVKRFIAGADNAVVTVDSFANDPQRILDFYKDERRREFCFEEFRWFDLRRYGMPEIVHIFNPNEPSVVDPNLPVQTYTIPQGGKRYVMKIPVINLEANPLLTQND